MLAFSLKAAVEARGDTIHKMNNSFPIPLEQIIVVSICLFLSILAISVRIYTQAVCSGLRFRDYVILVAGAAAFSFMGVLLAASRSGLGASVDEVSLSSLTHVRFLINILDILYPPTILLAKSALLLEIENIAGPGAQRRFIRWCVWAMITVNGLAYTAILFLNVVTCNPRAKIFDPSVQGKCILVDTLQLATGAFSLVSDVALFVLPLYLVSKLKLSVTRGLAVAGIFVIGFTACGSVAVRLYHVIVMDRLENFTQAMARISIWSCAEITCIILVACLPSVPLLLASFQRRKMRRSSYPHIHKEWISHPVTRCSTPGASSKSELFHPTRPSPTISQESFPHYSRSSSPDDITPCSSEKALPSKTPTPPPRPPPPFEPFERPISHLSCNSYQTTTIAEVLDPVSPLSMPTSPISPVSGISRFSTLAQTGQAVEMRMTPVGGGNIVVADNGVMRFASSITKTVDVRVSNHTAGSPVTWVRAEDTW